MYIYTYKEEGATVVLFYLDPIILCVFFSYFILSFLSLSSLNKTSVFPIYSSAAPSPPFS
jgi:hypothetical protein